MSRRIKRVLWIAWAMMIGPVALANAYRAVSEHRPSDALKHFATFAVAAVVAAFVVIEDPERPA